jgi:hypothetical protein
VIATGTKMKREFCVDHCGARADFVAEGIERGAKVPICLSQPAAQLASSSRFPFACISMPYYLSVPSCVFAALSTNNMAFLTSGNALSMYSPGKAAPYAAFQSSRTSS